MTRKKTIVSLLALATLAVTLASANPADANSYWRTSRTTRTSRQRQTGTTGQTTQTTQTTQTPTERANSIDNWLRQTGAVQLESSGSIARRDAAYKAARTDPRQFDSMRYPDKPYRLDHRVPYISPDQWTDNLRGVSIAVREQIRPLAHKMDETYYQAIHYWINEKWTHYSQLNPLFWVYYNQSEDYRKQIEKILADNGALELNPITLTQ